MFCFVDIVSTNTIIAGLMAGLFMVHLAVFLVFSAPHLLPLCRCRWLASSCHFQWDLVFCIVVRCNQIINYHWNYGEWLWSCIVLGALFRCGATGQKDIPSTNVFRKVEKLLKPRTNNEYQAKDLWRNMPIISLSQPLPSWLLITALLHHSDSLMTATKFQLSVDPAGRCDDGATYDQR